MNIEGKDFRQDDESAEMKAWRAADAERKRTLGIDQPPAAPTILSEYGPWIVAGIFIAICIAFSV